MIWNLFGKRQPERIAADLLEEASVAAIEHRCAAEHHAALAAMFENRVVWFRAQQQSGTARTGLPQLSKVN